MKVSVKADGGNGEVRCVGTDSLLKVTWVTLTLRPGECPLAQCGLLVDRVDVEADAKFYALDPEGGNPREVRAIEWADGGRTEL